MRKTSAIFIMTAILSALIIAVPVQGKAHPHVRGRIYWESHASGDVVYEVKTSRKVVALTFDDGPDPKYTPEIMKELNMYHAKATFFVIGAKAEHYPQLVRRIRDNGDEIANHTYRHRQSRQVEAEDISKCDEIIQRIAGLSMLYFRPPGGSVTEQIVSASKGTKHTLVMWVDDARDWARPGTSQIVKNVMENLHPGAIILFHDGGGNRQQTVTAVDRVLAELEQQHYQCVTISKLMKERQK